MRKDGPKIELEVYAFLTTTPNELVATINHKRMPVLLTREEEFEAWLSGAPAEALALAREHPPGQMRIVQEDFKKQDLLAAAAWHLLDGWPRLKAARSLRQPLQDRRPPGRR